MTETQSSHNELILLLSIMILLVPFVLIFKRRSRWKLLLALFITVPAFVTYIPDKSHITQPALQVEADFTLPQQQAAFTQWFKQYQLCLDSFDRTWQEFGRVIHDLETGEHSKSSAVAELTTILDNSRTDSEELTKLLPPPELPLAQQELVSSLLNETQSVAAARVQLFETAVKILGDPKNKNQKAADLAAEIKKLAILSNPVYLDIMPKIAKIKTDLKL